MNLSKENIISVSEEIPKQSHDWMDFFNTPEFFNFSLTPNSRYLSFYKDDELIAVCNFDKINEQYISPVIGTFGGISLLPELSAEIIFKITTCFAKYIETNNLRPIKLILKPLSHNLSQQSTLLSGLLSAGFIFDFVDLNQYLRIDNFSFNEKLKRNNIKRLNKCFAANFTFNQVLDNSDILIVYNTIKINRESKGYNMSLPFEHVLKSKKYFPNRYFFFTAENAQGVVVASSICLNIGNGILYVFYWGELPEYKDYSPVVFLANGIYSFCKNNKYRILDIGTSSVTGEPNIGLINFKNGIGCENSIKPIIKKS
jgi:hypothetical protein